MRGVMNEEPRRATPDGNEPVLLLVGRVGTRAVAVPVAAVERVLPLAWWTPLPGPAGVVGVLDVHGTVLAVVDPRPRLGLRAGIPDPEQHLVLVSAGTRYLLWLDRVTGVAQAQARDLSPLGAGRGPVGALAQVDFETVPVFSPDGLDPGRPASWDTASWDTASLDTAGAS